MCDMGTRGVDEWAGRETEGEVIPEVSDGGFDCETVKFLCKDR